MLPPFDPEAEPHPFVRRFRKSWEKRFRHTRMEPLFEGVDLGNCLVALGRSAAAMELLHALVDPVEFSGNYNVWTPVGCGTTLLARLYRLAGEPDAAAHQMQRLVRQDYRVPVRAGELEELLGKHDAELADARAETQKWGVHGISRHLMSLHYFRETATEGFAHSGTYPVDPLEASIRECYAVLAELLGPLDS